MVKIVPFYKEISLIIQIYLKKVYQVYQLYQVLRLLKRNTSVQRVGLDSGVVDFV